MKKIFNTLLLFLIVINYSINIYTNRPFFTKKFSYSYLSNIYSNSQYILGKKATTSIGDDGLYAFAGYYLFSGGDPSQVNFEHPSLGKYLIGLSIYLFNNENVIYIFYGIFLLVGVYYLTQHLYHNSTLSLIAIFILSFSKEFHIQIFPSNVDQYSVTMLNLPAIMFLIFGILFLLKGKMNAVYYWLSSLFLGLAFITRFFPGIIVMLPVFFIYIYRNNRKYLFGWLFSLFLIPVLYLLSYYSYLINHSFIEFINFQKYIISWRLGNPVVFGNIFNTIFFGKYKNWWDGQMVFDSEWDWLMPVLLMGGLLGFVKSLYRHEGELILLGVIVSIYLVYLSFGTVGISRYFLPIYPLLLVLTIELISDNSMIKNLH